MVAIKVEESIDAATSLRYQFAKLLGPVMVDRCDDIILVGFEKDLVNCFSCLDLCLDIFAVGGC